MNISDQLDKPITDPSHFVGRQNLINKVYSRIGAGRPQSVSLVGDYKIGKTSLLNYLSAPLTQAKYFENHNEYYCLRLAVNEEINSLDAFVKTLCGLIATGLNTEFKFTDALESYTWFKRIVETTSKRNKKIILFMDDFNLVTQNESFPLEFFSFLRSLANNYNVAYVTTSYLDLQQLCVSKDVEESPFFNIFTNITIKAFDNDETENFIRQAAIKYDYDLIRHKDLIVKYAGNFPFLLQTACLIIKENPAEQKIDPVWERTFTEKFTAGTEHYFNRIWDNLNTDLQSALQQIAIKKKIENRREYLVQELLQKQLLVNSNSKVSIFSPVFYSVICRNNLTGKSSLNPFSRLLEWFNFNRIF